MPYVKLQTTREGATHEQKAQLIRGATELLVHVRERAKRTAVAS